MAKADSLHERPNADEAKRGRGKLSAEAEGFGAIGFREKAAAMLACAILLAFYYVVGMSAAGTKCPTFDEPLHLVGAWVQTHYDDFRCNPEDPPLWKFWAAAGSNSADLKIDRSTPLWSGMLDNMMAQGTFVPSTLYTTGADVNAIVGAARARMAVLGVVLGIIIGWWAWRLGGPIAGVAAVAVFSLDPNFLGHGSLIKNDVAMTLVFVVFASLVWFMGNGVTVMRWIALGLVMGAAMTTKFSGVLVFPMLGLAMLIRAILPGKWPIFGAVAKTFGQRITLATAIVLSCSLVAYIFTWGCYGFRFGPSSNPSQLFSRQELMDGVGQNEMALRDIKSPGASGGQVGQSGQRELSGADRLYVWADENHVLPQAWIRGFYYTWGRGLIRGTFLCGELSVTGWWYYFPLAILFKTPLETLLAILLAALAWVVMRPSAKTWTICAFLVCPVIYATVAIVENLNLGLRHIFPVYPFVFIFLGVAAGWAWRRQPRMTGALAGILLIGLVAETLCAFPNFIAFFNVAAGGSRGGVRLLGDSNLDWGQDLPLLAKWQKAHPDVQLYLSYFGGANPAYYGVNSMAAPGTLAPADENVAKPLPKVLAISATNLQGSSLPQQVRDFYAPLKKREPIAVLGGSIYLFDHADDLFPQQ